MAEKSLGQAVIEALSEKTPLALIAIGAALALVAGLGYVPGTSFVQTDRGGRIALFVTAVILCGIGVFLALRDSSRTRDGALANIAGTYFAENRRPERIEISHLSGNFYSAKHPDWQGVGLVDGDYYYGVYLYNDSAHPEDSGNVGAHKARVREGGGGLRLTVIELGNKSDPIELLYLWVKEVRG
jgi:hypothetical protein